MAITITKKQEYPILTKKEDTLFWNNSFKKTSFSDSFIRDVVRVRLPNGDIFKGVICAVGSADTIKVRTHACTHGPIPMATALIERIGENEYKAQGGEP